MAFLARSLACTALVWATLSACEAKTPTQVIVTLRAEPGLLADARSLKIVVTSDEGDTVLEREKALDGSEEALARLPLIPRNEDPSRRYAVSATLADQTGKTLARVEAQAGYTKDELKQLDLWFEDACRDKLDCGPGRTCSQGVCRGACFEAGQLGPSCSECEICNGSCQAQDGLSCGCPGESCSGGRCAPQVRVAYVSAGGVHTCASTTDGEVFCWGKSSWEDVLGEGEFGRLGTGPNGPDSTTPVLVPGADARKGLVLSGNLSCGITWGPRNCWGFNFENEISPDAPGVVKEPFNIEDPFEMERIDAGFRHVCGWTQKQELWCWGYNERGNLGLGHTDKSVANPTLVGTGYTQFAAGGDHTCAIDASGKLFCWGYNDSQELGVPTEKIVPTPLRPGCEAQSTGGSCFEDYRAVGAGDFHTCAIRESGEMFCFGGNENGQLGIGPDIVDKSEPQRVVGNQRWAQIEGGRSYSCALDDQGALYCWGLNEDRQVGTQDGALISSPLRVNVSAPNGWRSLGLGDYHACAVRDDRTLWCWGRNTDGQVGIGTKSAAVAPPRRVCF